MRVPITAAPNTSSARAFRSLLRDDRGASMVEYLIIVGCVALAAQTGFRAFGKSISAVARKQGMTISMLETGGDRECVGGLCVRRREPAPGP